METQLRGFLQRLLHQAIHAGIFSAMMRMPLKLVIGILALLIGIAIAFKLY